MRKIIITGLFAALIAAFAAAATPALAHEFVAKGNGTIQDKNVGNHVFETGLATVTCEEANSKGIVQVKRTQINKETVLYNKCKALSLPAEVSQAKYAFNAEGSVELENEVIVKVPKESCEIKVPSGQKLSTVTYTNVQPNGTMEAKAAVEGISSTLSGSGVLCPKGSTVTAKYKGTSIVELIGGGTLQWI